MVTHPFGDQNKFALCLSVVWYGKKRPCNITILPNYKFAVVILKIIIIMVWFLCTISTSWSTVYYKSKNQNTAKTNLHECVCAFSHARVHTHMHTCMHRRSHTESVEQLEEVRYFRCFESCECVWWPNFARETVPDRHLKQHSPPSGSQTGCIMWSRTGRPYRRLSTGCIMWSRTGRPYSRLSTSMFSSFCERLLHLQIVRIDLQS